MAVRRQGKKQRRMIRWTTKATGELMCVSHMQASNAVDVLMKYFEQIDFGSADNMHQTAVTTCVFAPRSKKRSLSSSVLALLIN